METIISEINVHPLYLKLSSERLYIKTALLSETFALRSIYEIRIIDWVDEFNQALTNHIKKRSSAFGIMITGIILFSVGLLLKVWLLSIGSILPLFTGIALLNKLEDPTLKSSLILIMSNGNRDFKFDKVEEGSAKIDEFVFSVETILRSIQR